MTTSFDKFPSPKFRISSFLSLLSRIAFVREGIYACDIANELKIDPSNLSRIFTGVTSPSIRTFVRLVDFFDKTLGRDIVIENFAKYVLYKNS